jgi:putative NADH-flavin reductase
MKILVFGATGKTGQHLISQALDKEYLVTAFARHPEKIKMQHPNLKILQGNVTDYEKVKEAIKGKDAVLSALGASSPFKFDQAVVDGAANIIRAMQAEQVSRLIYMSFIGVQESRNAGGFVIKHIAPRLLSTEIKGHEAREKMIQESPLAWTIIRAVTLTNGNHTGNYKSGEEIMTKGFTATISRADVAELMLHMLDDKNSVYKKIRTMY